MTKRDPNWHKQLVNKVLSDPVGLVEYTSFSLQLDLAEKMKKARKKAHLTQEVVAEKMQTTTTAVARLEAAGGKGKHSPSLSTLDKYAQAIGYKLQIKLVPKPRAEQPHS